MLIVIVKGLNPGVISKVGWVWSSGWTKSWMGLLLLTVIDVSTACAVVICRVKVSCITSVWRDKTHFDSKFVQICGRENYSKLNTLDVHGYRNIFRFPFCLYWLYKTRLAMRFPELHLGCHTCWLSCFTWAWLWCGRTGVRSRNYKFLPNFLVRIGSQIFFPIVLR